MVISYSIFSTGWQKGFKEKKEKDSEGNEQINTLTMLDLEYLILKEYHFRKEFNTDEFHNYFKYLYRGIFSLDEIKKALGDLHSRNYLETTNGKFHTLNITDDGERFYSLNEGTLKWIGFYKEIFKDYDTPIINSRV